MSLSANYIFSLKVKLISTHEKSLVVDITKNDMIPLVLIFLHALFGLGRVHLLYSLIWPLLRECNLLHCKHSNSIKRIIEVILQTVGNNYIINSNKVQPNLSVAATQKLDKTQISMTEGRKFLQNAPLGSFCNILTCITDNIFIRFGSKLYGQIVPMGTICAPLVADLFLFSCYERDFVMSLSDNNQIDINEALNSTSRYIDDLLNIDIILTILSLF